MLTRAELATWPSRTDPTTRSKQNLFPSSKGGGAPDSDSTHNAVDQILLSLLPEVGATRLRCQCEHVLADFADFHFKEGWQHHLEEDGTCMAQCFSLLHADLNMERKLSHEWICASVCELYTNTVQAQQVNLRCSFTPHGINVHRETFVYLLGCHGSFSTNRA